MNAQLALALLALGPIKTGVAAGGAGAAPAQPAAAAAPTSKDARDPIASLAREWLAKR